MTDHKFSIIAQLTLSSMTSKTIANGVYTCEHFSKPYILGLMVKQAPQTHKKGLANGTGFFVTIYVQLHGWLN